MQYENQVICGGALDVLRRIPDGVVQTCVTSPPYYRVRDYGHQDQLGLEPTVDEYVRRLVEVFDEVRRCLRPDGTLWLNVADSYASAPPGCSDRGHLRTRGCSAERAKGQKRDGIRKSMLLIPQRLILALSDSGWIVRSEIVWSKPCPMPESVQDRPTRAHEMVYLLSKQGRYHYDGTAIREPAEYGSNGKAPAGWDTGAGSHDGLSGRYKAPRRFGGGKDRRDGDRVYSESPLTRNARSVWSIPPAPFSGSHFATFPPELPRRCILASSRVGDLVLDPFCGSGTTCSVARFLARRYVGIELTPAYAELARARVAAGPQWSGKAPAIDDRQIGLFAKREIQ